MEKQLTPAEAWTDFEETVVPSIVRPLPAEIYRAVSHRRTGKLGTRRIRRLLEKYAPTKYSWNIIEFVTIAKPPAE